MEQKMQPTLEISFLHVEPDDKVKQYVGERVANLHQRFDGITSCHVYISAPQNRQKQGHLYDVTIELRVPGKELVVSDRKDDVKEHRHLQIALRDAFAIIERDLNIYKLKTRGEVKVLDGMLQGKIAQIDHAEGFGHIQATDHRLVYFHKNAVVDGDFAALNVGDTVELVARHNDSAIGPQASTVRPIGPLRYRPCGSAWPDAYSHHRHPPG